jgi:hypothetical protein
MQRDEAYLLDILIAARRALQFLEDITWQEFARSELHQNAVISIKTGTVLCMAQRFPFTLPCLQNTSHERQLTHQMPDKEADGHCQRGYQKNLRLRSSRMPLSASGTMSGGYRTQGYLTQSLYRRYSGK